MSADGEQVVRKRPRYFWPCVVLAAAAFLCVCAYIAFMAMLTHSMSETPYTGRQALPWTREAWFASEHNCYDGNRFMMVDDLLAQHALIGMTRMEVEQLLGAMSPADGGDPSGGRYCLGREDSWDAAAIDPVWLVVWFDEEGRVMTVETPQDLYR